MATQENGTPRPPFIVHPNDMVGIMQRAAWELLQYCYQPPENIDLNVCMGYASKIADCVEKLAGSPALPRDGKGAEGIHGKAN